VVGRSGGLIPIYERSRIHRLYAGTTSGGVFKSIDHAATWNAAKVGLPDDDILALDIDPKNSNILYAGTRRNGIFKSTYGGMNWNSIL
jgi:hypothetical protein